MRYFLGAAIIAACFWLEALSTASAQNIIWEDRVRVGNLIAFRSIDDEKKYYYAATRARLAYDGNLPKFSFVRFSERNSEGGDESLGGGVVHALVELGPTDDELERAREALREIDTRAELVGAVPFNAGTFTLISSVKDDEGQELGKRVVGVGQAPLLEGDRAAVSLLLTKRGANILWSTFNTPTPDISFSFTMEIDAYRSPINASIDADWSKVYNHENFNAAFQAGVDGGQAQVMMGAEIDLTFEELENQGAINIEYRGQDDGAERATEAAYNDLREIMFQPANMAGGQNFTPEYRDGAHQRVAAQFQKAEENRRRRNDQARADHERAITANSDAAGDRARVEAEGNYLAQLERDAERAQSAYQALERNLDELNARLQEEVAAGTRTQASAESILRDARTRLGRKRQAAENARRTLSTAREGSVDRVGEAAESQAEAEARSNDLEWEQGDQATISLYAAYRMKTVRQTGEFRQDLNKYRAQSFSLRFDSNIGDMRGYLDDDSVFADNSLDGMTFSQREIFVSLSDAAVADFEKYLNSATVQLRKVHEDGSVTMRSVRLAKDLYRNADQDIVSPLRMIYVSRGDRDAEAFNKYDYKVDWNYAGNVTFKGNWTPHEGPNIPISPPLSKQSFKVNLDPIFVDEYGIIGATVRLKTRHEDKIIPGSTLILEPGQTGSASGYSAKTDVLVSQTDPRVFYSAELTLETGENLSIPETETSAAIVQLSIAP